MKPPKIDDQSASEVSKHDAPEALLALSKAVVEDHRETLHVYTG